MVDTYKANTCLITGRTNYMYLNRSLAPREKDEITLMCVKEIIKITEIDGILRRGDSVV